jgi:hypothetical protein
VVHYGGQSTQQVAEKMFLQLYLGKLKYFRKHYGPGAGIVYKMILLLASVARLLATPLAFFQKPAQRERNFLLAHYYQRLLWALPRM